MPSPGVFFNDAYFASWVNWGTPAAPVLTLSLAWVSDLNDLDPDFEVTYVNGLPAVGDSLTIGVYTNSGLTALYSSANNVLDSTEAAAGVVTFAGLATLVAGTTYWAVVEMVRGGSTYASNTVTKTMASAPASNAILRADGSYSLRTDGSKILRAA